MPASPPDPSRVGARSRKPAKTQGRSLARARGRAFRACNNSFATCPTTSKKRALNPSKRPKPLFPAPYVPLEEAMDLHKKQEAICEELGNRDGLQASFGNQALILQAWGRLAGLRLHCPCPALEPL